MMVSEVVRLFLYSSLSRTMYHLNLYKSHWIASPVYVSHTKRRWARNDGWKACGYCSYVIARANDLAAHARICPKQSSSCM